jgi:trigger factor
MIMEYYQKNPAAADSLRGTIYENKIIESIKSKAKITKKEISKEEAEKILKSAHEHSHDHKHGDLHEHKNEKQTSTKTKPIKPKKAKSTSKKPSKLKKVSKK